MNIKTALVFVVVSLATPLQFAHAADPGTGSMSRLAGKAIKKVALPVTIGFAAYDAQAAYDNHCSHLYDDGEIAACTTTHFVTEQVEDFQQMARDTELAVKYVIIPEAEAFWDENGDDIKQTASDTADVVLDVTAEAFIALDRFLDEL